MNSLAPSRRFSAIFAASALLATILGGASLAVPVVVAAARVAPASASRASYAAAPRVIVRHWDKTDLAVYVERPAALSDDEWRETQTVIREGYGAWVAATRGRIKFTWTDAPRRADITIRLVPARELPPRAAGITRTAFRSRAGTITDAQIRIDDTMTGAALSAVAAHEMGHALGIGGHSPDPDDLMYPRFHLPALVTPADAATLLQAYDAAPTRKGGREKDEGPREKMKDEG